MNRMLATALFASALLPLAAQADTAPAYYVAEFTLHDADGIRPYSQQVEGTFAPYSGRYIVRGGHLSGLEGTPPGDGTRMIVIQFDSLKQAEDWYNSPEYTALRPIRQASGETNAYIMEGLAE